MAERLRPRKWHDRVAKPVAAADDYGTPQKAFPLDGKTGPYVTYKAKRGGGVTTEQRRYYIGEIQIAYCRIFEDRIELYPASNSAQSVHNGGIDDVHNKLKELLLA